MAPLPPRWHPLPLARGAAVTALAALAERLPDLIAGVLTLVVYGLVTR